MAIMQSTDTDFRVCQISFEVLLQLQLDAEERGFATRWTSVEALRGQVEEGPVLIQSMAREERGGILRAYRCLLLFSATGGGDAGGLATIDIDPTRFNSLARLDRDPDVRAAFVRVFSLALGKISVISKK